MRDVPLLRPSSNPPGNLGFPIDPQASEGPGKDASTFAVSTRMRSAPPDPAPNMKPAGLHPSHGFAVLRKMLPGRQPPGTMCSSDGPASKIDQPCQPTAMLRHRLIEEPGRDAKFNTKSIHPGSQWVLGPYKQRPIPFPHFHSRLRVPLSCFLRVLYEIRLTWATFSRA